MLSDKVEEEEEEESADAPGGCRSKNKNPTQFCGGKADKTSDELR